MQAVLILETGGRSVIGLTVQDSTLEFIRLHKVVPSFKKYLYVLI